MTTKVVPSMSNLDITKISDGDLCEAGRRLQEAHDYIEVHFFRIQNYDPCGPNGACCYIGTVKHVGKERCGPGANPPRAVAAALGIMDKIAIENGAKTATAYGRPYPGGAVEGWGLDEGVMDTPTGYRKDQTEQAQVALPVFRQAIREVQKEMDRRAN